MAKAKIALRDALRQGFSQVMGLPGVAYQRRGKDGVTRYYNGALDHVDADGHLVEAVAPDAPIAQAEDGRAARNGGLAAGEVAFSHGEQSFTNEQLLAMALAQSGMTTAEWNAQNDAQIQTRVAELVDDMKAAAGEDAPASTERAPEKSEEQIKLEGLRTSMDAARADLDAWTAVNDSNTKEGKSAYNRLYNVYSKAKKAYEAAAGLGE